MKFTEMNLLISQLGGIKQTNYYIYINIQLIKYIYIIQIYMM